MFSFLCSMHALVRKVTRGIDRQEPLSKHAVGFVSMYAHTHTHTAWYAIPLSNYQTHDGISGSLGSVAVHHEVIAHYTAHSLSLSRSLPFHLSVLHMVIMKSYTAPYSLILIQSSLCYTLKRKKISYFSFDRICRMMAVWHWTLAHHEEIPACSSLRVNHSKPYLIVFHVFQRDSGISGLEGATWRTPKSKHSHVVVKLLILKNQMWFNFT